MQYYCIGNIVHDRKLALNNKEYMINLNIVWNIIYFNHLEHKFFQSFGKTINTEKFSIIIATNFDNLMSVAFIG